MEIEGERSYRATALWTALWYVVPCVLYAIWLLTAAGKPGTTCAEPSAHGCPTPMHSLMSGAPRIGTAIILSILVALLIRRGSAAWRPVTTGFAAAVIGGGGATILFSLV